MIFFVSESYWHAVCQVYVAGSGYNINQLLIYCIWVDGEIASGIILFSEIMRHTKLKGV